MKKNETKKVAGQKKVLIEKIKLFVRKIDLSKIFLPCKGLLKKTCEKLAFVKIWWNGFIGSKFYAGLKRLAIVLVVLTIFVVAFFAIRIYGYKADDRATRLAARIFPYPVAVVNYDFVTYSEYLAEKDYIHHFYDATKQEGVNYADIDGQIINQLIDNKITEFESIRHNIHAQKSDVDDSINSIIEQNGGQDKVEKVLNDLYGLDLKDFRKLIRTQILRDKVNQKLIARVDARHILIRVDKDASQDKVDAAKAKIDDILKQIKDGADFAEMATKNSEDTGSAAQGGKLDPFAAGEMVKPFSDTAFKTPVGQISDPVRSDYGWHIIKVEGKTGTIEMSFSDWLGSIKDKSLVKSWLKI